ncbi:YrdB family protein [Halobacterium zhouii]|uniref:YrdB family protein n=1 Tax=Halobacterium zhouii TaxID=2902624 RepID=UPI001E50365E|nr:YrdB family protein [Halobacterium zhouii]
MSTASTPLGWVVVGVRFLLEMCVLLALGYWGYETGTGGLRYVLAVAAPLAAAVVWGAVVAPKAAFSVPPAVRLVVSLVVFAAAAGALYAVDRPVLAVAFAAVVVVDTALVYVLGLD